MDYKRILPVDPKKKIGVLSGTYSQCDYFIYQVCKAMNKDVRSRFIWLDGKYAMKGRHGTIETVYVLGDAWTRRDFNDIMIDIEFYNIKIVR